MWPDVFQRLGLVPAAQRKVKPMPDTLRGLVPPPTDKNITVKPSTPDVEHDTMPLIIQKVKRTLYQTKKLADKLKGGTLAETLRNDSNFILQYIKYRKDDVNHEQIRSPRRLVYDAAGDCDCFAVFLASVLTNQGIKFKFRITKYANSGGQWSHIYIIVPKDQRNEGIELYDRSQYYVLDPVTNLHDHEVSYKQKRDYTMSLQYLDGIGSGMLSACNTTETIVDKSIAELKQLRQYVDNETIRQQGLVPTEELLINNNIPYELKVDEQNNGGYVVVNTKNGALRVPTIITRQDANALLTAYNAPQQITHPAESAQLQSTAQPAQSTAPAPAPAQAGVNWWGILTLAGAALSTLKSDGPGGLPTPALGKVPTKKLRVVHF